MANIHTDWNTCNRVALSGYDRAFISYFLPGMSTEDGAWATSHYNPDLEIIFLRPVALDAASASSGESIRGEWIFETMGERLTLVYREGRTLMRHTSETAEYEDVLAEIMNTGVFEIEDNAMGEYYMIEDNGSLGIYRKNGTRIYELQPVR